MNEVVIDTASFILWSQVSFMEFVIERKLFLIILTKEVIEELRDPLSLFYFNKGIEAGMIKKVCIDESWKNRISVKYRLGKGEISCIAFCLKEKKMFVTDDIQAKKKAEKEGVNVKTTPQILREFIKERDVLDSIKKKFKDYAPKRFAEL